MVTNQYELPMEFDWIISSKALNIYLNQYGPMYVFEGKKKNITQTIRSRAWIDLKYQSRFVAKERRVFSLKERPSWRQKVK
jgi:hypothetical protein